MSKTILITLNNSGGDPGPYTLTLIDGAGNQTPWPSNPVTKAQLVAGYQMIVSDLIVKVKVQSRTCTTYVELTIPTTQCPCRIIDYTQGVYTFYECGSGLSTVLNVSSGTVSYCTNMMEPIVKLSGAGNYVDTSVCCVPGPTTTTTSSTTTTSTSTTSTSTSSTTTSTTTSTSTTTTTTAAPTTTTTSTTTTTTTVAFLCNSYIIENNTESSISVSWYDCEGLFTVEPTLQSGEQIAFCANLFYGPILYSSGTLLNLGSCV